VYRTDLLRRIGGFREGFEGSQDYDLALRVIEQLAPEQIRHIPRILYHWRTASGSLAAVVDAKPYAREAARRALADHLSRRGISGRVEACPENAESHRVVYELPAEVPLVSVIILTRDRAALLEQCVQSLRAPTAYENLEIVIVDNGSSEAETFALFDRLTSTGAVRVIEDAGEFNFSRLNNAAARAARGEVLAFLNNDIQAEDSGWLAEMVSHAVRPEVGAVGARLWFPNDTLQHAGVVLGLGGVAGHVHARNPRGHPGYYNRTLLQGNYSAVTGACMVVRREVFERLGGFNERELAVNFNDIDFCLRLQRRGLQIVWTPYANLLHHESASRGHHRTPEEQARFAREAAYMQGKWGAELLSDPFYNPNFSLELPGYVLAFPPRAAHEAMQRTTRW
jgi:GT2 family glycosyltransferase